MGELTEIQSFYKGRSLFITGASGFMGKVLLEKLLFSCSDLNKIYILLRPKRGLGIEKRLEELFKLPMFERLRKFKPETMKKVIPMQGDVTMEKLGLTDEQRDIIAKEVSVVFHGAATLRLEAKLRDAIEMNTVGTKRVIELCRSMKELKALVHLSTAFCHVDQAELGETTYDAGDDPHDVMHLMQWMNEDAVELVTPKLIHPHPNTYTYSKRLAETLIANEYPKLPCVIARPSIVTPSWNEPVPGWVDSLNGPVGLIVGAGKGVIRSMHCNGEYHAEIIPVDLAINALIGIAAKIGTAKERPKRMPVYNITQSGERPITWGEILEKGRQILYDVPFEGAVWYPDGDIRSSKFIHNLFVFFFHLIPAYFIDFLMLIFRQKRFMVRIQRRISDGLDVLQYFTTREWLFHNANLLALWRDMKADDKKIFPIDFMVIDELQYMRIVVMGARTYCMKESPDTLASSRRHLTMLYFIHHIAVYSFYFFILYYIYQNVQIVSYAFASICERLPSIPIISKIMEKTH